MDKKTRRKLIVGGASALGLYILTSGLGAAPDEGPAGTLADLGAALSGEDAGEDASALKARAAEALEPLIPKYLRKVIDR